MKLQPRFRALSIAALLALPLPAAAFAETLTVTGISVTGEDGFKLTVPTIEAVDSNLDEAGIRALFSADYTGTLDRLAHLDATSLTIPTITMEYNVPSVADAKVMETATITYSDLVLTDVEDGVAKGGASIGEIGVGGQNATVTVGKMSASLLDIAGIIGFYGLTGTPAASTAMKPIYKDFTFDGMSLSAEGTQCTIGPASASEFSARPLKYTLTELMARSQEMEAAQAAHDEPTPEQIVWMINFYADFLTAVSSTPSTVDGMRCNVVDPTTGRTFDIAAGEMTVGGFAPGIYPAISLNDMRFDVAEEGFIEFGNFTWKQVDFNKQIEALLAAGADVSPAWFEANWRKVIPTLDGFSLSGVSFDIPDENSSDKQRIAGAIGAFDASFADFVNGIPSNISSAASGVQIKLPDNRDTAPLHALGIDTLNLGYGLKLHWDEASKTIKVENLSFSGEKIGSITVSGTIANAGPELFSEKVDVVTAAAMLLTVTDLKIDVVNDGIAPLIIAGAAAEQKLTPEDFYVQVAGMARALPLAMLGGTQEAIALSTALGEFVDGTPQLTLVLKSVDPKGLSLVDFMAAQKSPETLKGKFTIAATVSGEKVPFVFPDLAALNGPMPDVQPIPVEPPPVEQPLPDAPPTDRQGEKAGGKN